MALPFGEMYPALQQKVVDGVELVYNNIPAGRFYEVLKYVSETGHIMLINFEVISSKFFNSLPADYQKTLVEECDKARLPLLRTPLLSSTFIQEVQTFLEEALTASGSLSTRWVMS